MNPSIRRQSSSRRPLFAGLAALVVALSLLALPPVRAAADDLLQLFRVKSVVFVPISQDRINQLRSMNVDGKTLFLDKPQLTGDKTPKTVASAAAASQQVGFNVGQVAALPRPASSTEFHVVGHQTGSFRVNVQAARDLMQMLGVTDVTLPDSLGQQPTVVNIAPFATTSYSGTGYDLTLFQGHSPEVSLPDGVDLPKLGKAMLQVLGTDPQQAEQMSRSIDWSSTLVVPFPADVNNIKQVSVNGTQAILMTSGEGRRAPMVIYWQSGDQFYVLQATGMNEAELLMAAESIR